MIDLRRTDLPKAIEVFGTYYELNTDFRQWLDYEEDRHFEEDFDYRRLFNYFKIVPQTDLEWAEALKQLDLFYANPSATPKAKKSKTRVIDFILDGEYIYASFMQVYGIDLLKANLHWHEFLALFNGLPSDCKIMEIIRMRSYKKSSKKEEQIYSEAKRVWALPKKQDNSKKKIIDMINKEANGRW